MGSVATRAALQLLNYTAGHPERGRRLPVLAKQRLRVDVLCEYCAEALRIIAVCVWQHVVSQNLTT